MCSEVQYNRASQSQGSAACKMPGMRPGCGAAFQAAEPQPNDRSGCVMASGSATRGSRAVQGDCPTGRHDSATNVR